MSPEDTVRDSNATDVSPARAPAPPSELEALRDANARLNDQLGRILRDLVGRDDVDVRVDLDAPPGEAVVLLSPVPRPGPPPTDEALAEVREVATRLEMVQRDLVRIQQNVEKLLWRAGEAPAPPLARPSP